jgi:hypothetical protein
MTCKRCGGDIESGEIHLFIGGENRRLIVEKMFRTKIIQCSNPPPLEYWK